jgi:ABC-type lipoprotein release transport system permease subunit
MATVWYLFRADWRTRWRSWLALAVLAGAAAGVVLAAVAGWHRTTTVQERAARAMLVPDGFFQVPFDDTGRADPDLLAQVRQLPQISVAGEFVTLSMTPAALEASAIDNVLVTAPVDGEFSRAVARPLVVDGRRADPAAVDELEINEELAARLGVRVGDEVPFVSLSPEQGQELAATGVLPGEPEGPAPTLTVIGVLRGPSDVLRGNRDAFPALVTPAFYAAHQDEVARGEGSFAVQLGNGPADLDAFEQALREIYDDDPRLFVNGARAGDVELQAGLDDVLRVPEVALILFALVAGIAATTAMGQAFVRQLGAAASDQPTFRALGMSRGTRTLVDVAQAAPVAVVGAGFAVVVAVAASPLFPFGVARRAEPEPGLRTESLVLGMGALVTAVAVLALAALAAWWVARRSPRHLGHDPSGLRRGSSVVGRLARVGMPTSAVTGVRMALEPGRGRTAVPVRQALVAAVLGVLGFVAAVVVGANLDRTVDTPARYGWNWDVGIDGGGELAATEEIAARVSRDPDVSDVAVVDFAILKVGDSSVTGYGFDPVAGYVEPTIIEGRAPTAPDEAALGSDTLRRFDLDIGDGFTVEAQDGPVRIRVVGRAVVPVIDSDEPAEGALFAGDLQALRPQTSGSEGYQQVVVRYNVGVDVGRAAERLMSEGFLAVQAQRPLDVSSLRQIENLPYVLALTLAFLGTTALAHAVVTAVRRRRRELAVFKALGFVRGQVASTVAWQATTIGLVGLLGGIPLGIVVGRWVWRAIADAIGVGTDAATPLAVLLLAVPVVLVVANAVAAVPARVAGRTRPADVLRSE